jgi:hypothetical protein
VRAQLHIHKTHGEKLDTGNISGNHVVTEGKEIVVDVKYTRVDLKEE